MVASADIGKRRLGSMRVLNCHPLDVYKALYIASEKVGDISPKSITPPIL